MQMKYIMNIFHGKLLSGLEQQFPFPYTSGYYRPGVEKMWPAETNISLAVKANLCPVSVKTAGYANSMDPTAL